MISNQKGFTLTELLLSSSISAFLISIVIAQNIAFFQQQMFGINQSNLVQDTILEASYLNQQIENSGGGNVRSWMSVWVDNGCPARPGLPLCLTSSDRLTVITTPQTPIDCNIVSQPSANSIVLQNTSTCCSTSTFTNALGSGAQLMLVLNDAYSQVYASAALDPVTCTLAYAPGQASHNDATQGVTDWSTGSVSVVQVQTYYVDPNTSQLKVFSDLDHTGALNTTNVAVLADSIFDLQAALGVDLTGTQNLVDTNSTTDDWLYNAPGDAPVFPSYVPSQIQMIEVGLISGTTANFMGSTPFPVVQVLDGPDRQSQPPASGRYYLRPISFKVTPKNSQ